MTDLREAAGRAAGRLHVLRPRWTIAPGGAAWRRLLFTWLWLPPWGQALAVFTVSRLFDLALIDRVARFQVPSIWNGPDPGYLGVVSLWDGFWYHKIAVDGYPTVLPHNPAGVVQQNQWGFYPLYPAMVRAVMSVLDLGWPMAATLTSLACAAIAVVVMRSLVEAVAGPRLALWTVVLFCAFPASPVLQLGYTEALAMLLVVSVLWCLRQRSYLLAVPLVVLLGLTRPVAAPIAVVIGLHLLGRVWRHRAERLRVTQALSLLVLVVAGGLAVVEWPLIAARVTGDPRAYADTMAAWRSGHTIRLFTPWWDASQYWLGHRAGPIALALLVAGTACWLLSRRARVIAGDLRAWVICYLVYLAAVLDPSTSLVRYLLALFPLGTLLAASSPSPAYRRALAVAFTVGQVLWVAWLWRFSPPTDWPP